MTASFSNLRQASWRGVPFGVEVGTRVLGRRTAEHEYPYRDGVFIEDLGRKGRLIRLQGFIVSDSLVYGGGDVLGQVARLETAIEASGSGILIHPTRGIMVVTLIDSLIEESWDKGDSFAVSFTFKESLAQAFPAILAAVSSLVSGAAGLAAAAGLAGLASDLSAVSGGLNQVVSLASTAQAWTGQVMSLAGDATALYGVVSQLGGAAYGRYFNGANAGFLQGLSSPYAGAQSVDDLIALGATQRAAVATAGVALQAAIAGYGPETTSDDVGAAAQALVAALAAATADPADGVRLLTTLAAFTPPANTDVTGLALSAVFRRAAVAQAALVSSTYAPSSADDANAVRAQVLAPINAEIAIAGASAADPVFAGFKSLRQAVFQDLGARGAALPALVTVQSAQSLPAAVLAQVRYGDIGRRDELVTEANPINPLFMPTSFKALAA